MKSIFLLLAGLAATVTPALAQHAGLSGTLLQFDFNEAVVWPHSDKQVPDTSVVVAGNFGTVDHQGSAVGSGGLRLIMDCGPQPGWTYGRGGYVGPSETAGKQPLAAKVWSARLASGPLAVQNLEQDLGKLTLSFDLSASRALPIGVVVESYNAKRERTGGLEAIILPAAADFYQRYALDLSTMKSEGAGTFDPAGPFVSFTFQTGSAHGWPAATYHELRLDNVHYAKPAYYVSPTGDDARDGRTEGTAFATPQQAMNAAQPGDIIVLMEGTYSGASSRPAGTPVAKFVRPGKPGAWITLKNYPGHHPVLSSHGQTAIEITQARPVAPATTPVLSYLEVRGLRVRGNGDTAREQYPAELGTASRNTDSQGILVKGRTAGDALPRLPTDMVHHIRLADNVVDFNTSDGVYVEFCDWLFIEHNRIENNCWTTASYAPSGLAVMGYANFDAQDNVFKILIAGNRASGNRLTVKNHIPGEKPRTKYYNGNGILLDANADKAVTYLGRTLVQNNLAYNNGAGGIQMWGSHRLDIVNNTVAYNATVVPWGQLGFEYCRDVRLINNIVVAPADLPLDTWFLGRADERTAGIVRINNLYWGGAHPNIEGIGDIVADPLFVNPSRDPATADFRLKPDSPALRAGRWELFTPPVDADGKLRPQRTAIDLGAYTSQAGAAGTSGPRR